MLIEFIKDLPNAKLPTKAHDTDVGYDLTAAVNIVIEPGDWGLVNTGLRLAFADSLADLQIRPRSGMAFKHGVTVLNSPGTVDPAYRGLIGVLLINHSKESFVVNTGDRVAQLVIAQQVQTIDMGFVDEDDLVESSRGGGGFGSTGA